MSRTICTPSRSARQSSSVARKLGPDKRMGGRDRRRQRHAAAAFGTQHDDAAGESVVKGALKAGSGEAPSGPAMRSNCEIRQQRAPAASWRTPLIPPGRSAAKPVPNRWPVASAARCGRAALSGASAQGRLRCGERRSITATWSCRFWPTPGSATLTGMSCGSSVGLADARQHQESAAS